jgi:hypothetical protein
MPCAIFTNTMFIAEETEHKEIRLARCIRRSIATYILFDYWKETALAYLQIPIITKSKTVTYVDMKLLALRTKIVTNSRVLDFHPIDSYTNRPEEFESIIFIESFTTYKTDRMTRGNAIPITRDNLRYYL